MRCAFYEKEVTPPLGGDIPGYYVHRLTEDVVDRLVTRAVVFAPDAEDPAKTIAVLTLDAVNCHRALGDAIKARVTEFTGIPYENIAVIANHSHYGIPHGGYGSDRDDEYMALLPRLAADTITLAYKRLQPCKLTYGLGQEHGLAFVRDYVIDNGTIVTNPRKFVDRLVKHYSDSDPDLPVLTAYAEDGKPLGVLFAYALHQDTVGGKVFSGDFSSEIANVLKAKYGPDFGSVFVPGFCGDINHHDYFSGSMASHRSIGQKLGAAIVRVLEQESAPIADQTIDICYRELELKRREVTQEMIDHCNWVLEDPDNRKSPYMMLGSNGYRQQLNYAKDVEGTPLETIAPLQILRIGDVWFYITPYEMYHQFAQPMKEITASGKWIISEMGNTESSYVAPTELMDTDIYPAWTCGGSWLEKTAGDKIVAEMKDMYAAMQ